MNSALQDRLYALLPELYRRRDLEQGQPLRALLAVLEAEFATLEQDIEALYDNWFIETCDQWTIPYLADLVGVRDLRDGQYWHPTERRRVANTVAYRRRKGTLAALEHVLADVTGWACRVVETGRQVAAAEHVRLPRPASGRTVDVRQGQACRSLHGPFNVLSHTVELPTSEIRVDARAPRPGHRLRAFHPRGLGLYVWRLRPFHIQQANPGTPGRQRPDDPSAPPNCFTFDPWGRDTPLFRQPGRLESLDATATAAHLPLRLTRADRDRELGLPGSLALPSRAGALPSPATDAPSDGALYGPEGSFRVWVRYGNDSGEDWRLADVLSADLAVWPTLEQQAELTRRCNPPKAVAVDVERGRFVLLRAEPAAPEAVRVDYTYAFSDDTGAHPCSRPEDWGTTAQPDIEIEVARGTPVDNLQRALFEWLQQLLNRHPDRRSAESPATADKPIVGVIRFMDSGVYALPDKALALIPRLCQLTITAAVGMRPTLRMPRLHVLTDFTDAPTAGAAAAEPGAETDRLLRLERLALDTEVLLDPPEKGVLRVDVRSSTLRPGVADPAIQVTGGQVDLHIRRSLAGPVRLTSASRLHVADSILDAGPRDSAIALDAIDGTGPVAKLQNVTVLGKTCVSRLEGAANCIFAGPVLAADCRTGSVRYSYLAPGSQTPPREHCLPEAGQATPLVFVSRRFGDPAYAQLAWNGPREILQGGEDGAEPGVFHRLFQPQRWARLRRVLEEYLPVGLDLNVQYIT